MHRGSHSEIILEMVFCLLKCLYLAARPQTNVRRLCTEDMRGLLGLSWRGWMGSLCSVHAERPPSRHRSLLYLLPLLAVSAMYRRMPGSE